MINHTARLTRTLLLLSLFGIIGSTRAEAQLPPEIGYIHPAGAKAGTTVDVVLAGYDWTPDMQYFFHDPRIVLEIVGPMSEVYIPDPPYWFEKKARGTSTPLPREIPARITIPAEVPPGPLRWQVANANGATLTGQFIVSHATEAIEDQLRTEAAALGRKVVPLLPELPIVISGRVKRIEEVDRYRFVASHSGPVTCELFARRIGSPFDGVLEVYDSYGNQLANVAGTDGHDLAATFVVQQGQEYTLHLYDVDFRGDRAYVYRLALTPGPRIIAANPSGGQRGTTQNITFTGYGLATGSADLETITQPMTFPTDPAMTTWNVSLDTPHGKTPEFTLFVDDFANVSQPADSTGPMPLAPSIAVTGMMPDAGVDRFTAAGKMGEIWSINVSGAKLDSSVDPILVIQDPDGKELARNDDLPGTTDAALTFTVPADGVYQLVIEDMGNTNVDRPRTYRLTFAVPPAGFTISAPDLLNVPSGASAELALKVTRTGGFADPLTVTIDGLPAGFTVPDGLMVPQGAAELKIPISLAATAAVIAAPVRVTASGTVNGQAVTQSTGPTLLAGTMAPPFKFDGDGKDDVTKWRRGTRFPAPVTIERNEGFTGEITFVMTAKNDRHRMGIWGPEMTVAGNVSHFNYPIYVPEWLETTRTSRMVLNGWAQVPDPQGNIRYLQAKMQTRIGFLPIGALFKVSHEPREYVLQPGDGFDVTLQFLRAPELTEGTVVELVTDEEQMGLLTAEPLQLPADQTEAVFRVNSVTDKRLEGEYDVKLRATTYQPGQLPVISETTVEVEFLAPAGADSGS